MADNITMADAEPNDEGISNEGEEESDNSLDKIEENILSLLTKAATGLKELSTIKASAKEDIAKIAEDYVKTVNWIQQNLKMHIQKEIVENRQFEQAIYGTKRDFMITATEIQVICTHLTNLSNYIQNFTKKQNLKFVAE